RASAPRAFAEDAVERELAGGGASRIACQRRRFSSRAERLRQRRRRRILAAAGRTIAEQRVDGATSALRRWCGRCGRRRLGGGGGRSGYGAHRGRAGRKI